MDMSRPALARAIQKAKAKIYDEWFIETAEFGFQDGGCWMFAEALKRWSGGAFRVECVTIADDPKRIQHVVAAWDAPSGTLYVDSDGVFDAVGMRDKVLCDMGPSAMISETSLSIILFKGSRTIPYREDWVARLAEDLGRLMPTCRTDRLYPEEP